MIFEGVPLVFCHGCVNSLAILVNFQLWARPTAEQKNTRAITVRIVLDISYLWDLSLCLEVSRARSS